MIEVKNYSKSYGNKKAVDNISFEVNNGEIFAFIGHNGAGKTTTLKSIVGILDFEQGDIYINKKNIKEKPIECKKEIAYIPDNPDIYDSMTGIAFLNFIGDIYEVEKKKRETLIEKYTMMFDINKNLGDIISSYSHGMKQKLILVSALLHQPSVLVLDEPFVGLDPKGVYDLKNIMHDLCKQGASIVFSTHILDTAEKLCDRVCIIKQGKIVKIGSMQEVKGDKTLENVFLELVEHE